MISKMLPHDESPTYFLSRQTKSAGIFFNNDMVGGFELTEFLLD